MFSHICPQYRSHAIQRSSTISTAMLRAEAVAEQSALEIVGLQPGFCSSVHFLSCCASSANVEQP